jgi:hypothetical protein
LRPFLLPHEWPTEQYERIKALRSAHDQLFRTLVEPGAARNNPRRPPREEVRLVLPPNG